MSDKTDAQKAYDNADDEFNVCARKKDGIYAGEMARAAFERAEEVAADVAALTKHVDELACRVTENDDKSMELITDLYERFRALESRGADEVEPDVDDIRVVGVFRETIELVPVEPKPLCQCGHEFSNHYNNSTDGTRCTICVRHVVCDCEEYRPVQPVSVRVVVDGKCRTCSGTGRLLNMSIPGGHPSPCPDCVRGVVSRTVTCAECRWYVKLVPTLIFGDCTADADRGAAAGQRVVMNDWACASWEVKP